MPWRFAAPRLGDIILMTDAQPVVKRTARAILLDIPYLPDRPANSSTDNPTIGSTTGLVADRPAELIVIKRTKPDIPPYWITPGGGVERADATVLDALHREVFEELGAKITDVVPAFVDTVPHVPEDGETTPPGLKVQHFFVCRLASMDPTLRHGPEVDAPRGTYEIVRLPFTRSGLASVDVVPHSLSDYLARNIAGIHALLAPDFG
jgi:8-oxo-dGTP pyrophosphatase MutT (NUDIX family)